jgi:hypothetical protein
MEDFIRVFCKFYDRSFNEMIQQYNSNKKTGSYFINCIISYKIENNKNIIYKEDIQKIVLKIYGLSQEEFMKNVITYIKYYNFDINNLEVKHCRGIYLLFYYISTFLEHEPVDIKIALKD